nr:hypothetical protein [Tanacetum cinerariifolium]
MAEQEIDNLTMEQYLALTRGNQAPSVVKPKIGGNVNFGIKSQFMRELREDTFYGNKNDDAHEHVELPLGIVDSLDLLKKAFIQRNIKSSSNSKGIAAIVNKLENLGRDIKKLKEKVHAIQVGCQNYKGAHLDKDCPLKEEVKTIKEVKYDKFK